MCLSDRGGGTAVSFCFLLSRRGLGLRDCTRWWLVSARARWVVIIAPQARSADDRRTPLPSAQPPPPRPALKPTVPRRLPHCNSGHRSTLIIPHWVQGGRAHRPAGRGLGAEWRGPWEEASPAYVFQCSWWAVWIEAVLLRLCSWLRSVSGLCFGEKLFGLGERHTFTDREGKKTKIKDVAASIRGKVKEDNKQKQGWLQQAMLKFKQRSVKKRCII